MVPTESPQDLEQGSYAPPLATGVFACRGSSSVSCSGFDLLSLSLSMIDSQVRVSGVGSCTSNLRMVFMDDSGFLMRKSKLVLSSVFRKPSLVNKVPSMVSIGTQ